MKRWFAILAPLLLFTLYLLATILFFFWGPIKYPIDNAANLIVFISCILFCFVLGYCLIIPKMNKEFSVIKVKDYSSFSYSKFIYLLLNITAGITIFLVIFNIVRDFSSYQGSIFDIILDPGKGYRHSKQLVDNAIRGISSPFYKATQPIATFSVLLTPAKRIFLLLGLIYWNKASKKTRILVFVAFSLQVIHSILTGTQIILGELAFHLVAYFLYYLFIQNNAFNRYRREAPLSVRYFWRKNSLTVVLLGCIILIIAVIVVGVFLSSRISDISIERALESSGFTNNHTVIIERNWLGTRSIFSVFNFGFIMLIYYASHGYYGLHLSLKQPFVWTCGLGSSRAIGRYLVSWFNFPDMSHLTYPARVAALEGYSSTVLWSTAFPWWASDVTFIGSAIIMLLIGVLLAHSWRQLVIKRNPIALVFLGHLSTGIFMIVANNQLFHTLENSISTVVISVVYVISLRINFENPLRPNPIFNFISGSFDRGGASKMLIRFIEIFNDLGLKSKLLVTNIPEIDVCLPANVKTVFMKSKPNLLKRLFFLRKHLNNNDHSVYLPFVTAMIINSYPFIRNRPNCGFDRGYLEKLPRKYRIFSYILYKRYFKMCFQTIEAANAAKYPQFLLPVIIQNPFLPSGIDPGIFQGDRKKTIVTVSRLSEEKRVDNVIRAYKDSAAFPEYTLQIYGSGREKKKLMDIITSLDLTNHVKLMGESENVMLDISDAGIFILASDNEGMPNALIEAMALGIPSISTKCMPGNSNHLIKNFESGLIVEVNSIPALVEAINTYVSDPELAAFHGKNATLIRKTHSPEVFYQDVYRLAEELKEIAEYVW